MKSKRGELILALLRVSHEWMEKTIGGATNKHAHTKVAGTANPLGATYAHVVASEDMMISMVLQHTAMLADGKFKSKIGMKPMMPVSDWSKYPKWTKDVKVNLPKLRTYAKAVYKATENYVSKLEDRDLDKTVDMTAMGMGKQSVAWVLGVLVIGHNNNLMGEIAVLKGLQGLKGYPF